MQGHDIPRSRRLGNFGGGEFFHYTAHGDAINIASRLESVNKLLGTLICISRGSANLVSDLLGRRVGRLMLKGKSQPVDAIEPLADTPQSRADLAVYDAAFSLMQSADPNALQAFAAYVSSHADDSLAAFHLRRLLAGERGSQIAVTGGRVINNASLVR